MPKTQKTNNITLKTKQTETEHQTVTKMTGIDKLCSMIILNINSHSDFQKQRPTELRTQI